MLKQTQSQKLSQKILPQIIQRQSLLAVPTVALEQLMKAEMELNPFLEDSEILETEDTLTEEKETPADEQEAPEEASKDDEYNWDDYFENESDGYKTQNEPQSNDAVNYDNMIKED